MELLLLLYSILELEAANDGHEYHDVDEESVIPQRTEELIDAEL